MRPKRQNGSAADVRAEFVVRTGLAHAAHCARDEFGVNLSNAVLVGDQLSDVAAARAAGCRAILLDPTGELAAGLGGDGYVVAGSLSDAADIILRDR